MTRVEAAACALEKALRAKEAAFHNASLAREECRRCETKLRVEIVARRIKRKAKS